MCFFQVLEEDYYGVEWIEVEKEMGMDLFGLEFVVNLWLEWGCWFFV